MPPVELGLTFLGQEQLTRRLERFELADADASPAFDAMADEVAAVTRRQFASEGRSSSGGWAPLSPRYAAWKARTHPGQPILVLTGALRRSLTERGESVPGRLEKIGRRSAVFGSTIDYGRAHQAGTGRLPRRPPVDLPEATRRQLVKIMQRHLVEDARRR